MNDLEPIRHRLLEEVGVLHGFGVRGGAPPRGTLRARQVHGVAVARPDATGELSPRDADAIVCRTPGLPIAVATADCVPILAATREGEVVAAIHAGWRGLAQGVVEAGIEALREGTASETALVAAVGPCIGRCCYEVDEPVLSALTQRFGGDRVRAASSATRPGHARIDLAALVIHDLERLGVARIGRLEAACTHCDAVRFDSFRRDGEAAGRMLHHIAAQPSAGARSA